MLTINLFNGLVYGALLIVMSSGLALIYGLRRVVIDPVSRVEGHGKVTLLLDEHRRAQEGAEQAH